MAHPLTGHPANLGFIMAAAPAAAASGPAAPFVLAASAAATLIKPLFSKLKNIGRGCGQSCVLTADAANEIERLLQANLNGYMQSGRTRSEQRAALAYFDEVWQSLVEFCSQPQFQSTKAGRNCIDDRKAGACKWRGDDGQCWNWFIGYRDPIADDPDIRPDPTVTQTVASDLSNIFGGIGLNTEGKDMSGLLLLGGALVLVYAVSQ